jgi:uncharacterized protein (DUF58 family)
VDDARKYLDPKVLAELKGLELKARLIVEGFLSGQHRSPFHGFSAEFAEHREYTPGDDLRYVDWKVFGKSDRFVVKQFEEETNFTCHVLLDASESMDYQSDEAPVSKLEYAQYVAASIAWLVIRQRDAVGLAVFDKELTQRLDPSGRPSHLKDFVNVLEATRPGGETELAPVFHEMAERIRQRGLVVVVSDLFDDVDSLVRGLKHFRHRRHDVSVIHVIDPAEEDFPFDDPTLFHGLEGYGDQMTDPRALRKAYREELGDYLFRLQRGLRELNMHYQLVRTDMRLDAALSAFLTSRAQHYVRG